MHLTKNKAFDFCKLLQTAKAQNEKRGEGIGSETFWAWAGCSIDNREGFWTCIKSKLGDQASPSYNVIAS